jgi:hypothetical protein
MRASGAAVSPPWSEVAPLLVRGGLTLGFAMVTLLLQVAFSR